MLRAINRDRYRVIPVGITRDGVFVLEDDDPDKFALDADRLPEVVDNGTRDPVARGRRRPRRCACGAPTARSTSSAPSTSCCRSCTACTARTARSRASSTRSSIPYAGGGVLDSALCMDKHFMKIVLQAAGVPVSPWVTVTRARWERDPEGVRADAAALGAAGVRQARARRVERRRLEGRATASELEAALELAFAEDDKVLIETAIVGREIEVAILEGRGGGGPARLAARRDRADDARVLRLRGQVPRRRRRGGRVPGRPARTTRSRAIQELGIRAFEAVDGRGLARVDFFLAADELYVNELNTMPGFTPISMFPKCWIASGMTYPELISELIDTALERAACLQASAGGAGSVHAAPFCGQHARRSATARRAPRRSRRRRCRGRPRPPACGRTS